MRAEDAIDAYGPDLVRGLADARAALIEQRGPVATQDEERFAGSWLKDEVAKIQTDRLTALAPKLDAEVVASLRQFVLDTAFHGAQIWRLWTDHHTATNMWVNGTDPVAIELADGTVVEGPPVAKSNAELINAVRSLRARSTRPDDPWDHSNHALEFVVADDGTRVTAIDYVNKKPFVTFRRPTFLKVTLDDLVGNNTMSRQCADFLDAAVRAKFRILISGSMNTGKTVLLRALASSLPKDWTTVTAESQAELLLEQFAGELYPRFIVALEARKAGADGAGAVSLNRLIEDAQRMSPKCVIVGELRGEEAQALAKSTGQGYMVMATVHGYSAREAISTAALYLEEFTKMDPDSALRRIANGIDLSVFMDVVDGKRIVAEVSTIEGAIDGVIKGDLLFDHRGVMAPLPESVKRRFDRFGIQLLSDARP